MPATSVKMALAVVGVVPIMILYPFFQKYFVKGITIGAVKGVTISSKKKRELLRRRSCQTEK